MNYGWDFSEMDTNESSSSANLVESHPNAKINSVQRNHISKSSARYINDDSELIDRPTQAHPSTSATSSHKNLRGTKNKNRRFRPIPLDQIITGCNQNGIPASRLIVPEENDPSFVKEYSKTRDKYDCIRCRSSQKRIQGKIHGNIFYAPEFHLDSCFPIRRSVAGRRLENLKDKKFKKHWRRQFSPRLKSPNTRGLIKREANNSSPIEIIIIDHDDEEEPYINNKQFKEECIITEPVLINDFYLNETKTHMNEEVLQDEQNLQAPEQEAHQLSPIMQRIKFQNEYLAFLAQLHHTNTTDDDILEIDPISGEIIIPPAKPFPVNQYFHEFNHPSARWLKSACQKLNLIYHQNAYQFWAYVNVIYITENSKPDQVQYLSEGKYSGFRALSYILSGHENDEIKDVIYKYFMDNFQSLGFFGGIDFTTLTPESDIIKETIMAEYITPELWETIARLLECRIGIFIGDKLVKYGNWNNLDSGNHENKEVITLLFQIVGEDYCIVKSVSN